MTVLAILIPKPNRAQRLEPGTGPDQGPLNVILWHFRYRPCARLTRAS